MKRLEIKRVLIPVDFSETGQLALEQGAYMASLFKAELYLLHVIEMVEFVYTAYDPVSVITVDTDEIEKNATKTLEEQGEKLKNKYGLEVTTLISRGRVVSELNEIAIDNKIDMIVMGTHGAKGFEEYFIGSNAHKITNLSPCPILTIQTHVKNIGFKNIVLPIDSSLHSRQKVDHAILMASHYGAFVHVLGLLETDDKIDENKFMIKLEAVENALKKDKVDYSRKIVHGKNLAAETMKFAEEVKGDLIIIMTDHESYYTGMFLGIFAKQIVNHSKIPVMSIKPLEGHYESMNLSASSNPFS